MSIWRAGFAIIFALWAASPILAPSGFAPSALARGALGLEQDVCVLKIGPDFMYFSGYQPAAGKKKFCEDTPSTGATIFALDFAQEEMREMTTDFRIVRDVGEAETEASLAAITIAHRPAKTYPTGTVDLEAVFSEAGDYVGIVTVDGTNGQHWVARFPFSVGKTVYSVRTPYYLLAAAAVLALLLLLFRRGA